MNTLDTSGTPGAPFRLALLAGLLVAAHGARAGEHLPAQPFLEQAGPARATVHPDGLPPAGKAAPWRARSPARPVTRDARPTIADGHGSRAWPLPQIRHFHGHGRSHPVAGTFIPVHPDRRSALPLPDEIFGDGFQCSGNRPGCQGGILVCLSPDGATGNSPAFSGDPANRVLHLDIGAGNTLTGIALDVRIHAYPPSWLGEARLVFSQTNPDNYTIATPFVGSQDNGTADFSSNGVYDLVAGGLEVTAAADGILRMEWSESFDDVTVTPDSLWGNHPNPAVCPGIRLVCSHQAACDAAVLGLRLAGSTR